MGDGKIFQKGVEKLCFVANKSNYAVCKGGNWDDDKEMGERSCISGKEKNKKTSLAKWALC